LNAYTSQLTDEGLEWLTAHINTEDEEDADAIAERL
jgi:hemerythrin